MKTLIVEDDRMSRLQLEAYLSLFGVCSVARSREEAVENFRAAAEVGEPYDLVCVDMLKPELDGHATVRTLREVEESAGIPSEHPRAAKVIMTTSAKDLRNLIAAVGRHSDAQLVKPIDTTALFGQLKAMRLVR